MVSILKIAAVFFLGAGMVSAQILQPANGGTGLDTSAFDRMSVDHGWHMEHRRMFVVTVNRGADEPGEHVWRISAGFVRRNCETSFIVHGGLEYDHKSVLYRHSGAHQSTPSHFRGGSAQMAEQLRSIDGPLHGYAACIRRYFRHGIHRADWHRDARRRHVCGRGKRCMDCSARGWHHRIGNIWLRPTLDGRERAGEWFSPG